MYQEVLSIRMLMNTLFYVKLKVTGDIKKIIKVKAKLIILLMIMNK